MSGAPIRVGLVLASTRGPRWTKDLIEGLLSSDDADVVGYRVAAGDASPDPRPGRIGLALLRSYGWIDRRVFGRRGDPAELVALTTTLREVPALQETATRVDLLILVGTSASMPAVSDRPTLGAWRLEHPSDPAALDAPIGGRLPPGGVELIYGRASTVTILREHGPTAGEPRSLRQVVTRVDTLSAHRGSRGHLRKLPRLVLHALRDLRSVGRLETEVSPTDVTALAPRPSAARIAVAMLRTASGYFIRRLIRAVTTTRWVLGIARDQIDISDPELSLPSVRILEPPPGYDWADPFPVRLPDREVLFIEEYLRAEDRGRLAVLTLDDSPRGWRSIVTILDLPTHLSYPFVFEWDGAWYLMPEQAAAGGLELYRAVDFPETWAWHSTVLPGVPAADPTLLEHDGRWWLFVALGVPGGNATDELHLFHGPTPLGPWQPHVRNPVVSDVRTARPAGRIVERDGRWFRPTQDGARTYGHSIVIMEIVELTLQGYRERVVSTIRPTWAPGLHATHTINVEGTLLAVDGLLRTGAIWPRRGDRRPQS